MAVVAGLAATVSRLYEPHYAGPADLLDAGFNAWYWHTVDFGRCVIPVAAFVAGMATIRSLRGKLAVSISLAEAAWLFYDLGSWMPNFQPATAV